MSCIPKVFLIIFIIYSSSIESRSIFINQREGKSIHLNFWKSYWLNKKDIPQLEDYFDDFSPHEQLCEENYKLKLQKFSEIKDKDYKYAYLKLRKRNKIDDIVLREITKFLKAPTEISIKPNYKKLKSVDNSNNEIDIEQALKQFQNYKKKRKCLRESFDQLFLALTKGVRDKKRKSFKKLIKDLQKNKVISKNTKKKLMKLSKVSNYKKNFSLKKYKQKLDFVNRNTSVETRTNKIYQGHSDFVSKKDKRLNQVPRSRLYDEYNQFQIIMLSSVMEKFLMRLEQTSTLGINLINEEGEDFETIIIDSPIEIYRFLVKYLRYEITLLKENHLFQNTNISYTDIITASFEMYKVPTESLNELSKIEDFWNPRISQKDKAIMWGKMFTQFGIIFIPPPYNYLATLSIMVIESFVDGSRQEADYEHSIFGEI